MEDFEAARQEALRSVHEVEAQVRTQVRTHVARPVHLIFTMIKWIRTGRLSINNSLSLSPQVKACK